MDNRQLYTSVGTYKGNLVAIRKVNKKNVELTRNIKKELKVVCISNFNLEKKLKYWKYWKVSKDEMISCLKMCSSFSIAFMYDQFIDDQLFFLYFFK